MRRCSPAANGSRSPSVGKRCRRRTGSTKTRSRRGAADRRGITPPARSADARAVAEIRASPRHRATIWRSCAPSHGSIDPPPPFVSQRRSSKARIKSSMTHDELAVRTGIDSSNIRSYESGRAMPSIHTIIRISQALDTEPGFFLHGLTLDHFNPAPARRRKAG
ncbi:MAG: helix-turn-helix domain-containing protein [Microbacterium sp.]|uniref:helix-turn-helix domain-containing protein n=1 Tax=Microbacterium sp. TaxID=51671 RepID=UPI0039E27DE5